MELKRYLGLILKRWKLVALVTLVTVTAGAYATSDREAIYESSGNYIVRPRILDIGETVRATETLNRSVEINSTYARIARSETVRAAARGALETDGVPTADLRVTSRVVPGTNIIEIGATGPDPEAVAAYADALGEETARFLLESDELFVLEPLDTPSVPRQAIPSRQPLTIALSLILGIAAGAALAFGVEYLKEPAGSGGELNLVDQRTGTYRPEYFRLRLREEMARCGMGAAPREHVVGRRTFQLAARRELAAASTAIEHVASSGTPGWFSLGLVTLESDERASSGPGLRPVVDDDLRRIARSLRQQLRDQDILAYIGQDTFAIIFPELRGGVVRRLLDEWTLHLKAQTDIAPVSVTLRVCECSANNVQGSEEGMRIACAV